jgi:hypothetical protein
MAAATLTTPAEVKAKLGLSDKSKYDDQIVANLPAAEYLCQYWAKQNWKQTSYTEYHTGRGTRLLVLHHTPVTSITEVALDATGYFGQNPQGSYDASSILTPGVDYALDLEDATGIADSTGSASGILYRANGVWPILSRVSIWGQLNIEPGPNYGNIRVKYVAGYAVIPEDIKAIIARVVFWMITNNLGLQFKSEKIGSYAYELNTVIHKYPEIGSIRQMLSERRDPVI